MAKHKNPHAVALGLKGGAATARKGSKFFSMISKMRKRAGPKRLPDNQVTKGALYKRKYRERLRKAKLDREESKP